MSGHGQQWQGMAVEVRNGLHRNGSLGHVKAGKDRQEKAGLVSVRFVRVRHGMAWQAWLGNLWSVMARLGKTRQVCIGKAKWRKVSCGMAGMVGFGWSGKGLTGQSWEWQVWN